MFWGAGSLHYSQSYGPPSDERSVENAKNRRLADFEAAVLAGGVSGHDAEITLTMGAHETPVCQFSARSDQRAKCLASRWKLRKIPGGICKPGGAGGSLRLSAQLAARGASRPAPAPPGKKTGRSWD